MKQIKSSILIMSTGRSLKADFSRVIKRFALLLTALFALQNIALAATVTILPSPPGAKRSASEGQSGYATENFDSFATGSIASGNTRSTAIGDWLATGSGVSVGDGSGNAILDNQFAAAGTNSSIAFTLTTPSRYIGFYSIWVSSGNTWTFYDSSNNVIATLDSASMVNLVGTKAQNKSVLASDGQTYGGASYYATGQSEPSLYVNLQLDDPSLYFTKVVFSNGSFGGNEFDNVTASAAYTPPLFTVAGSVSGLESGLSVVLQNNGGNSLTVNANGNFTFSTAINSGSPYAVTVGTQPTGQTCTVTNGTGTVSANVSNISVTCTTNAPAAIPTLSEWAMIFMASLMAMFGIRRMRRR